MPHSLKITPFPAGKLYFLHENYTYKKQPYQLEPGLSVILTSLFDSNCDYLGGHLEYYIGGENLWVEILEVQENRIKGKTEEVSLFFKAGSILWFEPKYIHRVRGNLAWNIKHLNVLVSEKIAYNNEKVGYFYNTLSELPMSFGRYFYSVSETYKPKNNIPLVEIPLSTLVNLDPVITNYLEDHAMDGWLRTSELTFKSFEDEICDRRIFPAGYETDDNIYDPPAEDLDFNF